MMEHTHGAEFFSMSESDSGHDLHVRSMNSQLLQENKGLKKHAERLRILLNDVPEFEEEKHTMLEALHQSCAREQEEQERLKEEERENECLEDALADLRYIRRAEKHRQLRLEHLKRAVFTAKRSVHEVQHALTDRDEVLNRRNAEIQELLALHEDCSVHAEETAARIEGAEKAARERARLRVRERKACKVTRKRSPPAPVTTVHSEVRQSRLKDMLVTVCSFILTLLFLLFVISSVIPPFSSEERQDISCTELILDSVKGLIVPFTTVHHTELPLT